MFPNELLAEPFATVEIPGKDAAGGFPIAHRAKKQIM
jgi:hypothetical protein